MSQVVDSQGDTEIAAAAAAQGSSLGVSQESEVSLDQEDFVQNIVDTVESTSSNLSNMVNEKYPCDNSIESDFQEVTIELQKAISQPSSSTPTSTVEDYEHTPECRICKSSEGKLVVPCKCSGTSQYVHLDCLKKWIESRPNEPHPTRENYFVPNLRCEICHDQYNVELRRNFVWSSKYTLGRLKVFLPTFRYIPTIADIFTNSILRFLNYFVCICLTMFTYS